MDFDSQTRPWPGTSRSGSLSNLITGLSLMVLFTGCIIPGPIEERVVVNQALKIHIEFLDPSPESTIWIDRSEQDAAIRTHIFSFSKGSVEDPDEDTLHYYWYLDYSALKPSIETVFTPEYEIDPCDENSGFTLKDEFGLTSIVADRPLDLSVPDFRTFPENTSTATVTWRVVLYGTCTP